MSDENRGSIERPSGMQASVTHCICIHHRALRNKIASMAREGCAWDSGGVSSHTGDVNRKLPIRLIMTKMRILCAQPKCVQLMLEHAAPWQFTRAAQQHDEDLYDGDDYEEGRGGSGASLERIGC